MVMLGGIQLSIIELVLSSCLALFALITLFSLHRISRLQAQLAHLHDEAFREIKMVNQGAIGLGRRFSHLESNMKNRAAAVAAPVESVSATQAQETEMTAQAFEAYRRQAMAESEAVEQASVQTAQKAAPTRRFKTVAEQSLSRWMNEQKMA